MERMLGLCLILTILAIEARVLPNADILNTFSSLRDDRYLWPQNTIPYQVEDGAFSRDERNIIDLAMQEWERFTCIRFRRRTTERNGILYTRGSKCNTDTGMSGGTQQVVFSKECLTKTDITRMLGRVLGLVNEHQRPDRDLYVSVQLENIQSEHIDQFNRFSNPVVNTHGIPYDYKSLMHFSPTQYSKNGQPTIRTSDPRYQKLIGQSSTASFYDVMTALALYSCTRECNDVKCPAGGRLDKYCDCVCPTDDPNHPTGDCDSYVTPDPPRTYPSTIGTTRLTSPTTRPSTKPTTPKPTTRLTTKATTPKPTTRLTTKATTPKPTTRPTTKATTPKPTTRPTTKATSPKPTTTTQKIPSTTRGWDGRGTGPTCIVTCNGLKDGDYQSCKRCDGYVSCVGGRVAYDRDCNEKMVWNDIKKVCDWSSPTCRMPPKF